MRQQWKDFWRGYRRHNAETEADLFVEVGRTIAGRPISPEEFVRNVENITGKLELQPSDVLFEFCCGNGLLCYELAPRIRHVIGIDFAGDLIDSARRLRARENAEYHVADALDTIEPFVTEYSPNKYLMGQALAYFDPLGFAQILSNIAAVSRPGSFAFLLTGIPDQSRMRNYYNTPERWARLQQNKSRGDIFNDGMGRWWSAKEIVETAKRAGLNAEVTPEPWGTTNYRMDALIR